MKFSVLLLCLIIIVKLQAQDISKVDYPLLVPIDRKEDIVLPIYRLDSCQVKSSNASTYWLIFLRNDKSVTESNVKILSDSSLLISIDFRLIDTIQINENYFIAINPYKTAIYEKEEYDESSGLTDLFIVWETTFKIDSEGKLVYYPLLEYEELFCTRKKKKFRDKFIENLCGPNM